MSGAMGTREAGRQLFERQMKASGLTCEALSGRGAHYLVRDPSITAPKPIRIRLTTSANATFSLYSSTRDVGLLVYLWIRHSGECVTYALTYDEAYRIMREKGYTNTHAWNVLGGYSVTHSGSELKGMLEAFQMSPKKWRDRIRNLSE